MVWLLPVDRGPLALTVPQSPSDHSIIMNEEDGHSMRIFAPSIQQKTTTISITE